MLLQKGLCIEKLLHTDALTHRGFYAKRLLHTEADSSAEPALLPFELLSVFLLLLPDDLLFVFPFPKFKLTSASDIADGERGTW